MSNSKPYVAVVIPVYNVEKYIDECLTSIQNQTTNEIEIICVNDGSTDNSADIIKSYIRKDSRIKLFEQNKSGVSQARNLGINKITAECVVFVDADDHIELDMIEILWNNYKKNDSDIIVYGGKTFPSLDWVNNKLYTRDVFYEFNSINALFYEIGSIPFAWNKMYKLDLLKKHNVQFKTNLSLGEDQVFQFSTFPVARKIQFISEKLYNYRVDHQGSTMTKFAKSYKHKNNMHLKLAQSIIDEWERQGYLSGNERHLFRWIIKFFKDCTLSKNKHAIYFSTKVIKLLDSIAYTPSVEDDFYISYQKIIETAKKRSAPLISVIIPVFNSEIYLHDCIDSILNQSFKNFEIIFIDDGSEDNSLSILRNYEDADPRVTILQQKNSFAGVARNYGMEFAKGKYLVFLDSDDIFEPDLLKELYFSIVNHDSDICVCSAKMYDHVTHEYKAMPWVCKTKFIPENFVFSKKSIDLNKYIYCFTTPAPWNKIFKKSFIEKHGLKFQNTRSANDMYFVLMALSLSERIVINSKELLSYRVNNKKSLQSTQDNDFYAFYDALCKLKQGLLEKNIYTCVKKPFINFALDFCLYNLGTIKQKTAFTKLYDFIKNDVYANLDIYHKGEDYFYGYTPSNGKRKQMLIELSADEYIKKFNINLD